MGCATFLFIFLHVLAVTGSHFVQKTAKSTWSELSQWLVTKGGWVQDGIQSDLTPHGGAMIRGLVLHSSNFMGSTLLQIPRDLWLTLGFWPDLAAATLVHHSACSDLSESQVKRLKFASGLAVETQKGDASKHATYLRNLPPLSEYRSFHPSFMNAALQEDFRSLPTVHFARTTQQDEAEMKLCFQAWNHEANSPVQNVKWEDIELGLSHLRNRGFIVERDPILVPVVDLINTERSDLTNADVQFNSDMVSLVVNSVWLSSGQELLFGYCNTCDNNMMLSQWGVYLEGNTNPLPADPTINCEGNGNHSATNASAMSHSQSLKEVSLAALDFGSHGHGTVPRCRGSLFSSEQGALRCSMARLSYEYCGHLWEKEGGITANNTVNTRASSPDEIFLKSTKSKKAQNSEVKNRYIPLNSTNLTALRGSHGSSALRKRKATTQRLQG